MVVINGAIKKLPGKEIGRVCSLATFVSCVLSKSPNADNLQVQYYTSNVKKCMDLSLWLIIAITGFI